jgi:hypothetical protein
MLNLLSKVKTNTLFENMKNKMKSAIGVALYAIGMGIMLSYIVLLNLIEVNPFNIIFLLAILVAIILVLTGLQLRKKSNAPDIKQTPS